MGRPSAALLCLIVAVLAVQPVTVAAQDDSPFPDDTIAVGLGEGDRPNMQVAIELSRATFPDGGSDTVLIGRDDVFADSLTAGAAQADGPLLLVRRQGPVAQSVLEEIQRLGASRAIIFGGTAAVSDEVRDGLTANGLATSRVSGENRVVTAVAVAQAVVPDATTAILARAGGTTDNPTSAFADALSAGGLAAANRWPVLLTQSDTLPPATEDYLQTSPVTSVVVMGGTAAVSRAVVEEVEALGIDVQRIAGPTRAATAVALADFRGADSSGAVEEVIVVDGYADDGWAAGFAAAARSAQNDAPIVLGNRDALPLETAEWLAPGPSTLTCATTLDACEQARLAVGFEAVLLAPLPPGTLTFTATDGTESGVYAAAADGSPLGLAYRCETAACTELDWAADGQSMALMEIGTGVHELDGLRLHRHDTVFSGRRVLLAQLAAGDDQEYPHLGAAFLVSGDGARVSTVAMVGSGGSHRQGAREEEPPALPSFQVFNRHPDYLPAQGAMLYATATGELRVKGNLTADSAENVAAHAQRRVGSTLLGAAWSPTGNGDLAITDVIGDMGQLTVHPFSGAASTIVDGVDAAGVPVWSADGQTILVLARVDGAHALVAVDMTRDGRSAILVPDTGAAADARIDVNPSVTLVAWPAGNTIVVLDTADGSVSTVDMPDGHTLAGGPAFRP